MFYARESSEVNKEYIQKRTQLQYGATVITIIPYIDQGSTSALFQMNST